MCSKQGRFWAWHIAWTRDKGYRSHRGLTGSTDGLLPPVVILTTLIEPFRTSKGCEGSGRTLTQSTKQLGFGGGDKPAFQRDSGVRLLPGELPDGRSRKMKETVRSGFELPETMSDSQSAS